MPEKIEQLKPQLDKLLLDGEISDFTVLPGTQPGTQPRIWVSWAGDRQNEEKLEKLEKLFTGYHYKLEPRQEEFYFLGNNRPHCSTRNTDEMRPGSGLIRVFGGKSEGPGGTMTCLLMSKDGQDVYFAAAGHVLTDFWRDLNGQGSIYRYRKGFPATGSSRFLGKVNFLPNRVPEPVPIDIATATAGRASVPITPDPDIGIVKLVGGGTPKQRTTCYGSFGEGPPPKSYKRVIKCGAQETHWTEAAYCRPLDKINIFGPNNTRYVFYDQILLRDLSPCESREAENLPRNPAGTPFAVPGDSGTLVVEKDTKRPVGMVIAGSVLDGAYVMTPFEDIKNFFDQRGLVMQRA
jgi:hypothetical protein